MPLRSIHSDYVNVNQFTGILSRALHNIHTAVDRGNRTAIIHTVVEVSEASTGLLQALLLSPDPLHWYPTQQWGTNLPA